MSQSGIANIKAAVTNFLTLTGNSGGPVSLNNLGNINVMGDGTNITITGNPATHTLTVSLVGGGGSVTIDGDTGSATGSTITFNANSNSGSSVEFSASGSTVDLLVTDANTNTIIGKNAGKVGISGVGNTGLGNGVFNKLTSGNESVAIGDGALAAFTIQGATVAIGYQAGTALEGFPNTLVGFKAGTSLTSADHNTAIGYQALNNVNIGTDNIAIGHLAGSDYTAGETDNIVVGNVGVVGESSVIRIGSDQTLTYVAGITGATPTSANTPQVVLCDSIGNLAVISSGSSGTVLTSNGTATPSFQAAPASAATAFLYILASSDMNILGGGVTDYYLGSGTALTKIFDTTGTMMSGANLTIPTTGYWTFNYAVTLFGLAGATDFAMLAVNTTTSRSYQNPYMAASDATPSGYLGLNTTITAFTTAGDVWKFDSYVSSAPTQTISALGEGTNYVTYISGHFIGT